MVANATAEPWPAAGHVLTVDDLDRMPDDGRRYELSQALADAIAWRYHRCRPCRHCAQSLCRACTTDWDQADRYHALALTLGAVGDHPSVVSRCSASSCTGLWSRTSTSPS